MIGDLERCDEFLEQAARAFSGYDAVMLAQCSMCCVADQISSCAESRTASRFCDVCEI